jgi:hypothetical protein
MMVDHQNVFSAKGGLMQKRQIASSRFCHQFSGPGLGEGRAIDRLMPLGAGGEISPTSYSLVVDNLA